MDVCLTYFGSLFVPVNKTNLRDYDGVMEKGTTFVHLLIHTNCPITRLLWPCTNRIIKYIPHPVATKQKFIAIARTDSIKLGRYNNLYEGYTSKKKDINRLETNIPHMYTKTVINLHEIGSHIPPISILLPFMLWYIETPDMYIVEHVQVNRNTP